MTDAGALGAARGRPWWVRLRAVLATGLVLGAGATTTLAAWTDQTIATGQFSTATFTVEANPSPPYTDDSLWVPHAEQPAILQFDAEGMTPGAPEYAGLALRAAEDSVEGAAEFESVEIGDDSDSDLANALHYRVAASATCNIEAFSGEEYIPLTSGQLPDMIVELPEPPRDPAGPGQPVHLCFELSLPGGADNALQGKQVSAQWQIVSTSETS